MRKLSTPIRNIIITFVILLGVWILHKAVRDPQALIVDGALADVIDGDSFKTTNRAFRIYGIDAPEYRQKCKDDKGLDWECGKFARVRLQDMIRNKHYSCDVRAIDQYQRAIVSCIDPTGADLGAGMVREGLALSSENYGGLVYADEQLDAEQAKRGIWIGTFISPKIWRAKNPR